MSDTTTTAGPCEHCPMAALGLGCAGHLIGNRAICARMEPGYPHREVTIARQRVLSDRFGWTAETEPSPRGMPAPAADRLTPRDRTVWTPPRIARLRPMLEQCPYAATPGFRGCGCRACWWKGRNGMPWDVALKECLECMEPLAEPIAPAEPTTGGCGL